MTNQQWQTIEGTLSTLTVQEMLEPLACLMRSIQAEVGPARSHTGNQLERLRELRRKLAAMPTGSISDDPRADLAGEELPHSGLD